METNKHLRLKVLSVDLDDEAMYECLKDISGSSDPVAPFYLNVSGGFFNLLMNVYPPSNCVT